jgi:protein SCO1/2
MSRILLLVIRILILLLPAATCVADGENRPFDAMEAGFELTNAQGERVTEQDIRGHHVLLAFGFTHCLHICPMMAANMAMALED